MRLVSLPPGFGTGGVFSENFGYLQCLVQCLICEFAKEMRLVHADRLASGGRRSLSQKEENLPSAFTHLRTSRKLGVLFLTSGKLDQVIPREDKSIAQAWKRTKKSLISVQTSGST